MAQKLTHLLIILILLENGSQVSFSRSKKDKATKLLDIANDYISRAKDLNPACFNYEYHMKKKKKTTALLETATNLISAARNAYDTGVVLSDTSDESEHDRETNTSFHLNLVKELISDVKDLNPTCLKDDENPDCDQKQKCSSIFDEISKLISEAKNSCSKTKQVSNKKKVVCYISSWAHYRKGNGTFQFDDIPPNLCTHAVYAFAKMKNNRIASFDPYLDLNGPYRLGGYKTVNALKHSNPNLKTLLAIGGEKAGSALFSSMAADPGSRGTFVKSVVPFLKRYKFDGLDINWEYPGSDGGRPEDKNNFVTLLRELKAALNPHGLLLSASVPARKSTIDKGFNIPAVSKELDLINLMTYDFHGSWERVTGMNAPLYASTHASDKDQTLTVDFAVNYWLKSGAPKEKLVLGLGLFGRSFTLVNGSHHGVRAKAVGPGKRGPWTGKRGSLGFNEICVDLTKEGWTSVFDSDTRTPYAYKGNQWVSYDDKKSLGIKMDYLMKKDLAGGMLWSIDTDDFKGICYGRKWYLLTTVAKRLMR